MTNRKRNLAVVEKRKRQQMNKVRHFESNTPKEYTEEEIDLIAHSIAWVRMIVFMFLAMGLAMLFAYRA